MIDWASALNFSLISVLPSINFALSSFSLFYFCASCCFLSSSAFSVSLPQIPIYTLYFLFIFYITSNFNSTCSSTNSSNSASLSSWTFCNWSWASLRISIALGLTYPFYFISSFNLDLNYKLAPCFDCLISWYASAFYDWPLPSFSIFNTFDTLESLTESSLCWFSSVNND